PPVSPTRLTKTSSLCIDGKSLDADSSGVRASGLRIRLFSALQIPIENWHAVLGDPTLADAILDRLVHNTYRVNLSGESMRKHKKSLTDKPRSE
ncbi:ATP-binding protein, partial [Paraburkholderia caribensis]